MPQDVVSIQVEVG